MERVLGPHDYSRTQKAATPRTGKCYKEATLQEPHQQVVSGDSGHGLLHRPQLQWEVVWKEALVPSTLFLLTSREIHPVVLGLFYGEFT